MDSARPPSTSPARAGPRSLRPWYLVATMVLTWFLGVHGLTSGCSTLRQLRDGSVVDMATATETARNEDDPRRVIFVIHEVARMHAMAEVRQLTFPLTIAKLLLAGLLVVASGLAMAGRPGARSLALQALVANAALAVISYVVMRDVRGVWIEAVARAGDGLPPLEPGHAQLLERRFLWWLERMRLATFDLGALGIAALALTRQRTKIFFEAVAEAAETTEEP
jgi:hypothetical protein